MKKSINFVSSVNILIKQYELYLAKYIFSNSGNGENINDYHENINEKKIIDEVEEMLSLNVKNSTNYIKYSPITGRNHLEFFSKNKIKSNDYSLKSMNHNLSLRRIQRNESILLFDEANWLSRVKYDFGSKF